VEEADEDAIKVTFILGELRKDFPLFFGVPKEKTIPSSQNLTVSM
jgi:hypothetical protein